MKISIAMATYNGAQYIQEQLQSFVDQARQPDELIITDDCSTDGTEAIVHEFSKTAPFRVDFHRNKKSLGYCGNFNAALLKTTGDLVFLSDQDDVWFPEKIEHMLGVAESNPEALVVMNDAALTDCELKEVGLTKVGQIRSAGMDLKSFVMGCCCAIRRDLLELCMPIPAGFKGHDNWLVWFGDGLNAKVIDTTVLQYYRRHEANESQFIANRITKVTKVQAFLKAMKKLLHKDAASLEATQVEQLRIFVAGVDAIESRSPDKYHNKLAELKECTELRIQMIEKRMALREKWFCPRVIAVGLLLAKGGYRNTNSFKAVLRDILLGR